MTPVSTVKATSSPAPTPDQRQRRLEAVMKRHQYRPDALIEVLHTAQELSGLKWATVAKMPLGQKYVVGNADEGDPGAYMDRSVLESDPHRVLEGMAIAAYAVGANQGYIYVRGEYPLTNGHLQTAIGQAKHHGVLGFTSNQ